MPGRLRCGIVTFTVDDVEAQMVQAALQNAHINAGVLFRALAQLDLGTRRLDEVVRVGVHCFNTEEELDKLVAVIDELAEPSRR